MMVKYFKWKNAFGQLKCSALRKVIYACLAYPHGNADVEVISPVTCNFNLHRPKSNARCMIKEWNQKIGGTKNKVPFMSDILREVWVSFMSAILKLAKVLCLNINHV